MLNYYFRRYGPKNKRQHSQIAGSCWPINAIRTSHYATRAIALLKSYIFQFIILKINTKIRTNCNSEKGSLSGCNGSSTWGMSFIAEETEFCCCMSGSLYDWRRKYMHNWPLQPFSQDYWVIFSHHLCCVC